MERKTKIRQITTRFVRSECVQKCHLLQWLERSAKLLLVFRWSLIICLAPPSLCCHNTASYLYWFDVYLDRLTEWRIHVAVDREFLKLILVNYLFLRDRILGNTKERLKVQYIIKPHSNARQRQSYRSHSSILLFKWILAALLYLSSFFSSAYRQAVEFTPSWWSTWAISSVATRDRTAAATVVSR